MSKKGNISQIMGAVVDVSFPEGQLPEIYNALEVDRGGKDGKLTLELTNVSRLPITLYYGMRIGQISFLKLY